MNIIVKAHKLSSYIYSKKFEKYRAEIDIHNMGKQVFWLSFKQLDNLENSFKDTDYSVKGNTVYLALEKKEGGKYRYIWSAINDKGIDFLIDKFDISVEDSNY